MDQTVKMAAITINTWPARCRDTPWKGRQYSRQGMATICAAVLNLPSQCTATLPLAPILAIHSRKAEMVISRPIMLSAIKESTRFKTSNISRAAHTINLSETDTRKEPKDED